MDTPGGDASAGVNLTVAVRCRPLSAEEQKKNVAKVVTTTGNKVVVTHAPGGSRTALERGYTYDKTFSPYSTQLHVFESLASPVVDEVLLGYNCTIFAYGPTGTGKTHTMEGRGDGDDAGIITRCAKAMFERLERNKDADFSVRVSCLEVYNEEMTDLLACENLPGSKKLGVEAKREKRPLRLVAQEGKESKGVVCANLDEPVCESMDECLDFLRRGAAARRVAATLCNDKSSRSHAIYTLKVCVRSLADDGRDLVVNGQLNLVDLAGSECVGRSGAKDVRAREAGNINQSLLTLGRVITALVTASGDSKYVPYRDSKLTRLLQESLGGRAKTTLIATVSPGRDAVEETLSTLQYALRARSIQNKPEQRASFRGKALLKAHSHEVDELQRMLKCQRDKAGGITVPNETWDGMISSLESRRHELAEVTEALDEARTEKVEAEKQRDDLFAGLEVAEEQRFAAMAAAEAAADALAKERLAHAETRHCEEVLAKAHAKALQDAVALRCAMEACLCDLDKATQALHVSAETLCEARSSAGAAGAASLESAQHVVAHAADLDATHSASAAAWRASLETAVEKANGYRKGADGLVLQLDAMGSVVRSGVEEYTKATAACGDDFSKALGKASAALRAAASKAAADEADASDQIQHVVSKISDLRSTLDAARQKVVSGYAAARDRTQAFAIGIVEGGAGVSGCRSSAAQAAAETLRTLEADEALLEAEAKAVAAKLESSAETFKKALLRLVDDDASARQTELRQLSAKARAAADKRLELERSRAAALDGRFVNLAGLVESSADHLLKENAAAEFHVAAGLELPISASLEESGSAARIGYEQAASTADAAAEATDADDKNATSVLIEVTKAHALKTAALIQDCLASTRAAKASSDAALQKSLSDVSQGADAAQQSAAMNASEFAAAHAGAVSDIREEAEAQVTAGAVAPAVPFVSEAALHEAALQQAKHAFSPPPPRQVLVAAFAEKQRPPAAPLGESTNSRAAGERPEDA
mmetsp:Transcript_20312/g.72302  ORF Transcript_20312/g.72302 Transcript_20312/m.72302 type:complete len:1002 (+) Transcript_20312:38-3043(+)